MVYIYILTFFSASVAAASLILACARSASKEYGAALSCPRVVGRQSDSQRGREVDCGWENLAQATLEVRIEKGHKVRLP